MGSFKLKLVLWFALLALLPLAVAFYGYDSLATRSETRRTDAALESALRSAIAVYAAAARRGRGRAPSGSPRTRPFNAPSARVIAPPSPSC